MAVFATGVAALHGISLPGSNPAIVVSDVTHEAVRRLFSELLPQKYGIEATFLDAAGKFRKQRQSEPIPRHCVPVR